MHENYLSKYTIDALNSIPDIKLYCGNNPTYDHIGTIPFNIKGIPHSTVAKILSYESGISVRNGCFCAQPYIQKLLELTPEQIAEGIKPGNPRPGMVRISLGLYNTTKEIDVLISTQIGRASCRERV